MPTLNLTREQALEIIRIAEHIDRPENPHLVPLLSNVERESLRQLASQLRFLLEAGVA